MNRIILILITLTALAVVPGFSQSDTAGESWQLETGLNFTPGLIYNRSWDPGYNGTSVFLMLIRESGILLFGTGVETGYSYTGFNILFPLKIGMAITGDDDLKLYSSVFLIPGMIMARPVPYFLIGTGITVELNWKVNHDFHLSLSAGPRYMLSPEYSTVVAPLELLDLNIGIGAEFRL